MSISETGPDSDPNQHFLDDYEPLKIVTKDPYGRRSMAWRRKNSDKDKLISATELTEARTTYLPERNMFRRLDRVMCFMISNFGGIKDARVGNLVMILCLPFVMPYLGYLVLMAAWDRWRAGPPPETE